MSALIRLNEFIGRTFAIWILLFGSLAFLFPTLFQIFASWIPYLLGIVMLGMGLTLTFNDFGEVLKNPKATFVGVVAQYLIMPLVAYGLTKVFRLPDELAIGVILVGCCPGGTSSNVMTYLAKGNVALSVACTTLSTLLAPFLTPWVFWFFAREYLDINATDMLMSVLKMILLPIFIGLVIRTLFKKRVQKFSQTLPLISVIAIILILSAVVAVSQQRLLESSLLILFVVMLHNIFGYFIGFFFAKLLRLSTYDAKAVSIEVGMQNSGLGVALATIHFKTNPIIAVPSAIFSFWHNLSGPMLASLFSRLANHQNSLSECASPNPSCVCQSRDQ